MKNLSDNILLAPLSKIILGIFLALTLFSFGKSDPSLFNQSLSLSGTENFFGILGSFLAGSLIEIFGVIAYLIPFLLFFFEFNGKNIFIKVVYWVLLLFSLSSLPALLSDHFPFSVGIAGKSLSIFSIQNGLSLAAVLILSLFIINSLYSIKLNLLSLQILKTFASKSVSVFGDLIEIVKRLKNYQFFVGFSNIRNVKLSSFLKPILLMSQQIKNMLEKIIPTRIERSEKKYTKQQSTSNKDLNDLIFQRTEKNFKSKDKDILKKTLAFQNEKNDSDLNHIFEELLGDSDEKTNIK